MSMTMLKAGISKDFFLFLFNANTLLVLAHLIFRTTRGDGKRKNQENEAWGC